MAAPGITIVYSMPYRGTDEEWSQRYHVKNDFSGESEFLDQLSELSSAVRTVIPDDVHLRRAYGYHNTDDDHAFSHEFGDTVTGVFVPEDGVDEPTSGDVAAWIRWDTGRMSHGKHVYLRKYFHRCFWDLSDGPDKLATDYKVALTTLGEGLILPHSAGFQLAGPDGNVPSGDVVASTYLTTRTLKRRGARPTPP